MPKADDTRRVALFSTCLAAFFRPSVVRAAARLLNEPGFAAEIPDAQTCCGQPNLNGGDRDGARTIARHQIKILEGFDYVVVPSGSCAGTIIHQYPALFPKESVEERLARELAAKTYVLTAFLSKIAKWKGSERFAGGGVALHDSCSCFRELGIFAEPREVHLLLVKSR